MFAEALNSTSQELDQETRQLLVLIKRMEASAWHLTLTHECISGDTSASFWKLRMCLQHMHDSWQPWHHGFYGAIRSTTLWRVNSGHLLELQSAGKDKRGSEEASRLSSG